MNVNVKNFNIFNILFFPRLKNESVTELSVGLKLSETDICTLRVLGVKVKSEENTAV